MNRTVVSRADVARVGIAAAPAPPEADKYVDRLVKYVPPDVIAVFLAVEGAINTAGAANYQVFAWVVFGIILVATPFYLAKVGGVTKPAQIVIATVAFAVWAFAYSGPPFSLLNIAPLYSTVVLALYTFLIPLIEV